MRCFLPSPPAAIDWSSRVSSITPTLPARHREIRSAGRTVVRIRRQPAVFSEWPTYRVQFRANGERGGGMGRRRGRIGTDTTDARPRSMAGFALVVTRRTAIAFDSQGNDGNWHIWTVDSRAASSSKSPRIMATRTCRHGPTTATGFISRGNREIRLTSGNATFGECGSTPRRRSRSRAAAAGTGARVGRRENTVVQPGLRTSPLMAQPLGGGPPSTLIACVLGTRWQSATRYLLRHRAPPASRRARQRPYGCWIRGMAKTAKLARSSSITSAC